MSIRADNAENAAIPARHVVLVMFDGAEAIDVAGAASVFSKAEQMRPGAYRLHLASPDGGDVATNSALVIRGTKPFAQLPPRIDTLVVAGGDEGPMRAAIRNQRITQWLSRVAPATRRIASVCSGAFALAAAGLLDGRQATTHWSALDLLQRMRPSIEVRRDRIYVRDERVWTSAGVVTCIELALALVEDDLGHEVAMAIARTLALPMLRGGHEPQISEALRAQQAATGRVRELVAWIGTHLRQDLRVAVLAERASMSPRHFARAFAAETGCTPARFVERARAAAAADFLARTRWTQERIAERTGFGSVDALQRAVRRHYGVSAGSYRDRAAPQTPRVERAPPRE